MYMYEPEHEREVCDVLTYACACTGTSRSSTVILTQYDDIFHLSEEARSFRPLKMEYNIKPVAVELGTCTGHGPRDGCGGCEVR